MIEAIVGTDRIGRCQAFQQEQPGDGREAVIEAGIVASSPMWAASTIRAAPMPTPTGAASAAHGEEAAAKRRPWGRTQALGGFPETPARAGWRGTK